MDVMEGRFLPMTAPYSQSEVAALSSSRTGDPGANMYYNIMYMFYMNITEILTQIIWSKDS